MKRHEHTFQFHSHKISEAAKREHEYHRERLNWWQAEHERAILSARTAGISINEALATITSMYPIDPSIRKRLNECATKIDIHRQRADEFMIHADAYASQDKVFDLHPDDIIYFRLAGGDRKE